MNCRAAQRLISAERDGALSAGERTELEAHVAGCAECSRAREALAEAAAAWTKADRAVPSPDAERAWHEIRRSIRADSSRSTRSGAWWLARGLWASVPVVAAAALAVVMWTGRPVANGGGSGPASWAQYVEVDDSDSSPFVFVDETSGWVVVWASDSEGGPT